jgi:hypothetical protein
MVGFLVLGIGRPVSVDKCTGKWGTRTHDPSFLSVQDDTPQMLQHLKTDRNFTALLRCSGYFTYQQV